MALFLAFKLLKILEYILLDIGKMKKNIYTYTVNRNWLQSCMRICIDLQMFVNTFL